MCASGQVRFALTVKPVSIYGEWTVRCVPHEFGRVMKLSPSLEQHGGPYATAASDASTHAPRTCWWPVQRAILDVRPTGCATD